MTRLTPLRVTREFRGLTLRQVRDATGIGLGRLSMMERDMVQPKLIEARRLSTVLDVQPEDIFPTIDFAERGCHLHLVQA